MKIKVIDLLNKIANDEEVPKKIKWLGKIYEYSCIDRFYYQNSWSMYRDFYTEGNCLNDEVEIIEEDKRIEKCKNYEDFLAIDDYIEHLRTKIDELIDEINNLKEND